jgi:hypothetical protein
MGVVDEADGEATADGDGAGEATVSKVGAAGREEPNPRGGMRWVAGGAAIAVVAGAAWWSGAGNGDSREIPVHAGPDGALIAGERTPNSGTGDFNSSNGSSHMKIQTTAAAALLGAAAGAFQAQAGDAVQWRVEDGGNGHWYLPTTETFAHFRDASAWAQSRGAHLATLTTSEENSFAANLAPGDFLLGGYQDVASPSYSEPGGAWRWVTDEPWVFTSWMPGEPQNGGWPDLRGEHYLHWWRYEGQSSNPRWNDAGNDLTVPPWNQPWNIRAIIEWSADCNNDNIVDYGQCHDGTLPDFNGNNVPDCCESGEACVVGNYPVQWQAEDGGNGHWYQVTPVMRGICWEQFRDQAVLLGGYLATSTSAAENAHIYRHAIWHDAQTVPHTYLGGFQSPDACEPDCGWTWVTDEPWVYSSWADLGCCTYDEDVLELCSGIGGCGGRWRDDRACLPESIDVRAVYEWSADCNNDNIVDYGQILQGQLVDANTNGIPDICEARLTIRVPADQPTIQAAIDAAPLNTQCIVAVSAGTYAGPIDFKGKSVIVRGAGASQTVISGSAGSSLSVVRFTGGEPAFAALENVSIRGGGTGSPFPGSPQFQVGGGLFAYNSAASVRDCVFENNTAAFGGGAYVWNCTGSIQRCAFRNNSAGADGAGIQLYRGSPTVVDTIVENNTANSRGGGLHIVDGTPNLVRTIVRNNISSNNVGGVSWVPAGNAAAFLSIDGCNVTGNTAAVVQGGIGILEDGATTKVSLHGTTVCENLPRPNVAGRFIDLGGNVVCDCAGDLNLDGVVNGADLGLMLSGWGPCGSSCLYDLNVDGVVNGADLGLLLAAWGTCGS